MKRGGNLTIELIDRFGKLPKEVNNILLYFTNT